MKKKYLSSRGWRNNNHLNIVRTKSKWVGLAAKQSDKRFCVFTHPRYGYRAALLIMDTYLNYFAQRGREFNILNVISRWCPAGDGNNRPLSYANIVAAEAQYDLCTALPEPKDPSAADLYARIFGAMCHVETGCPMDELPWDDIKEGIGLA